MKRSLLIVGFAVLVSLLLVWGCGKQEEPAKAQKPAAAKTSEIEQKPPAQRAATVQAAPIQAGVESKEPQTPEPTKAEPQQGQKYDINQALLAYLAKTDVDPKYAEPRQTTLMDLNSDGRQDALVLLQNPMYFCGTGGCTLLVFKGTPSGFAFVSRTTLVRGPLLVSETKTHGWRDLIVEVSGGGMAAKQVVLKFTGSKYPLNPSILPALPKNQPLKGTQVFSGQT
jgi:putative lipoprotein